jgi:hypothetical protein
MFGVTDGLSCSQQSSTGTVCDSMEAVQHTLVQLSNKRSDKFFMKVLNDDEWKILEYDVPAIGLPRHIWPAKLFDQQCITVPAHNFTSAEDYLALLDGVFKHIVELAQHAHKLPNRV